MGAAKETRMKQTDLATASVAEAYLGLLASRGIDYLFGNGGTDFAPVAEALAKMQADPACPKHPQPFIVPHENVAVAMAHGYYMATGRVQAVMVHVGLGTANSINGLFNAARQNVPILFTAGRTPLTEGGLPGSRNNYIHWAQEMFDQAGMVRELVKWDYELRHPLQLETAVDRALAIATTEPQGPVYLTLPREVLAMQSEDQERSTHATMHAATRPRADPAALAQLAQWLREARTPLIITADTGRDAAAVQALAAFATRLAIPVVQYRPRYLCLPAAHAMNCGFDPAPLIGEADLVLVLDCDVPWIPDQAAPAAACRVAHLGVDPLFTRYPMRGFRSDLAITGEVTDALVKLDSALASADAALDERIAARRSSVAAFRAGRGLGAARDTQAPASMNAKWFSRCIDNITDQDTVLVNEYPLMLEELSLARAGSYFANSPAGGLGWGLGAALGIKLALPRATVIAAVGDGAYMFGNPTPAHFVSRAAGLPVLFVIFNNRRWAAVHRSTLAMYPRGYAAKAEPPPFTSLEPSPAYEKIVEASGGYGECVSDPAELPAALQRALHAVRVEKRQAVLNVLTEVSYSRAS
jgi:acetolactate synthase-1/2/3 large subunit